MIAHVSGIVAAKNVASVVVDVGGIGYKIQVSRGDLSEINLGEKILLQTYHHIREQAQELFGFIDGDAKHLFEQLLSVKNVGPKVALGVLDTGPSSSVRTAIASGDVKFLQAAKGVGKRAAEQMVVELRDKVGLVASDQAEDLVGRSAVDQQDEALQATEQRIKLALKRDA